MSVKQMISESMRGNALSFKELVEEELNERVRARILEMIEESSHEDEDDNEDDDYEDDEDDEDDEDEKLDEAIMADDEVLKAAKALAVNGKNSETKDFGKGLIAFHKKNGSFTPAQVSGLQNIMKNATFQMAKPVKKTKKFFDRKLMSRLRAGD